MHICIPYDIVRNGSINQNLIVNCPFSCYNGEKEGKAVENYEWVYFLTIAEEGSLTKAAQKLFISQSALSQYLCKLEKRLGLKLYERRKNHTQVLTPAGVRYRRFCEAALQLWKIARDEMNSKAPESAIVICIPSPKRRWLLEEYIRSRPDMTHFLLQPGNACDLPDMLLSGQIQIAMGGYIEEHPLLHYRCLLCREMNLLVPWDHPLANRSYLISGNEHVRVRLSELGDQPVVHLEKPMILRKLIDKYCEQEGVVLNIQEEVDTDEKRWQIAAGRHMATFHFYEFDGRNALPGLVPVALDPPVFYTSGVFYRKDLAITPVMLQVIERYCSHYFE